MLNRFFFLGFTIISFNLTAQIVDQVLTMGGSGQDGVSQSSVLTSTDEIILVSSFQNTANFDPQGTSNLTSAGGYDIAIQKIDASGNLVWVKQIGNAQNDVVYDVKVDSNDDIYIIGTISWGTVDIDPGAGVFDITATSGDYFYLKLDSNGDFLWGKNTDFQPQQIVISGAGELYATGSYQNTVDFDPGVGVDSKTTQGLHDVAIVKLDVNGDFAWVETMGGAQNEIGRTIGIDNANDRLWIGIGFSSSSFSDYPAEMSDFPPISQGGEDILVLCFDLLGQEYVFQNTYGTAGTEQLGKLTLDSNQDVLVTGRFQNTIDFDDSPDTDIHTALDYSVFVLKVNNDFSYGWTKTFGNNSTSKPKAIAVDAFNNVYSCGYFYDDIDLDPSAGISNHVLNGVQDYYIQKLDASGNYIWSKSYGGTGVDDPHNIHINNFNEVYVAGRFENTVDFNQGETPIMNETSTGGYDIFIQKFQQCTPSTSTAVHAACNSFTWIDGNTYTASNNTATHILNNAAVDGCDSIITLNLTINTPVNVSVPSVTPVCVNETPFHMNTLSVMPSGGSFTNQYISQNKFSATSAGIGTHSYNYSVIDLNGCLATGSGDIQILSVPSIDVTITNANCGQQNGSIEASINGGLAPYIKYWSNGENTDIITSLAPNNYYYNITDANNCKAIKVATVAVGEVGLTGTVVSNSCYGEANGSIDLNVSGTTGPHTFFWSNGSTGEDINNLLSGQYEVFVTDANGCTSTKSFNVLEPDFFTSLMTSNSPSTCNTATGSITTLINGGTTPYVTSWENNVGTEVSTSQNPTSLSAGVYTLMLTDANNCTYEKNVVISDPSSTSISVNSITNTSCTQNGSVDMEVNSQNTIVDTLWSNGQTTEDLINVVSGDYSLQLTDDLGCKSFALVTIEDDKPEVVDICMVSVNTTTNTNLIIWEKPVTTDIDYFIIYRETSVANQFLVVDSVDYDDESIFTDPIAYPHLRSWRYKLSTVNTCGVESDLSIPHKTIHITVSPGLGNDYNINWDSYEGFIYSTYDLWRFTDANAWELIQSLPTSSLSFTDTPPSDLGLDYRISIAPPSVCQSTKAQDHNASRSNTTSSVIIGNGTDGVPENETNNVLISPNPSTGLFYVSSQFTSDYEVSIYDMNGRIVKSFSANESNFAVDLSDFEDGVYILEINSDNSFIKKQLVKQ